MEEKTEKKPWKKISIIAHGRQLREALQNFLSLLERRRKKKKRKKGGGEAHWKEACWS